jgi:hypothetical protein
MAVRVSDIMKVISKEGSISILVRQPHVLRVPYRGSCSLPPHTRLPLALPFRINFEAYLSRVMVGIDMVMRSPHARLQ